MAHTDFRHILGSNIMALNKLALINIHFDRLERAGAPFLTLDPA